MPGKTLILLLVLLFFFFKYQNLIYSLPLHPDEHDWVRKADIARQNLYDQIDQPKLTNYFYYLVFYFSGKKDLGNWFKNLDFNQGWKPRDDYAKLWEQNKWWIKLQGQAPQGRQVQPIILARYTNVFLTLLTLVFIYFSVGYFASSWIALVAILFLGLNPAFYENSLRAMAEGSLGFFWALALFLGIIFYKARLWQLAVGLGIVGGLAVATKFTGAGIIFFLFFLGLLTDFKYFILSLVISLLVFFIHDPFLWSDPIAKANQMLVHRQYITLRQQQVYSQVALITPLQKITKIKENIFPGFWSLILFVPGFIWVIKKIIKRKNKILLVFLFWFVSIFLTTFLFLALDWPRYYFTLALPTSIFQALAFNFWLPIGKITGILKL